MSNYNVDTLENKIVVEAKEAIKSLQEIIGYVNQSKTAIDSMKGATGLKTLDNQTKKTTSNLTKLQLVSKSLKSALNFSGLIYGAKRAYGFLKSSTDASIDYIETLNLFEVSMGKKINQYGNLDSASSKYYTRALKFQRELNERFGTNIEETMRYQALYNQMSESMGIDDNSSYIISENLTKLGIDLASLFNKSEEDTMEALRAGVLAGQTKPLRNYGLDVTQQTLAPLASELGIDRSVKQLSQAEKMILRYIAVLRQASSAHGDFAKTIESPANQLKVFKQQLAELKTAIGNLFQGLIGQILPYVNGVLMVIKELIKAVASLFGFKVSSSSTNLADQTGIEDLESGLGGAVGSAKELKAQLMGFDEINNITTDTSSGGGGGGVSSTGIDSKLLNAMKDYDNLMSKVNMKATKIRDNIMKWLGFTKKINPLTGEISWELKEGWTNLKKIWTIIKGLVGLYLITKVVSLIGNLTKLWNVLKGTTTATSAFGTGLQTLKGLFTTTTAGVGKHAEAVTTLNTTAIKATAGIAGLGLSMYGSYDAMRDFSEGTKTAEEATGQLAISIGGATASGALIGSVFGPAGTVVGALAGAVGSAVTALIGYQTEGEKAYEVSKANKEASEEYIEAIKSQREEIEKTVNSQLAQTEYTEKLVAELENLVDANGSVKSGYEDRVSFILNELNSAYGTEYQLINGQIKGYKDLKDNIYDIITAKKAEIILNANATEYEGALKRQIELQEKKASAQDRVTENQTKYDNKLKEIIERYGSLEKAQETALNGGWMFAYTAKSMTTELRKYEDALENANEELHNYTTQIEQDNKFIVQWENAKTATITGNAEEIEKTTKQLTLTNSSESQKQVNTLKLQLLAEIDLAKERKILYLKTGEEINETTKEQLNAGINAVVKNLKDQSKTVAELTPEVIDTWKTLAQNSYEIFEQNISELSPAVQEEIKKVTDNLKDETPNTGNASSKLASSITEAFKDEYPNIKNASEDISKILTKNMDGTFSINFGLNADYSGLKRKLQDMRNTISKMTSVSIVGASFLGIRNSLDALINQLSVKGYAEGGFPDMGEIFMAREAGPELVGRIGSRTAVANNSQIVEAVSRGVFEAVSSAMPKASTVQLDIRADEGIIVKKASQGFRDYVTQTGELPFPIPV